MRFAWRVMMLLTVHPKRIAGDMLQRLIMERPGGAIVLCGVVQDKSGEHIGRALREGNIPFVIYGDMGLARDNPSFASEIDAVTSDHEAGSYALTKWLISQGTQAHSALLAACRERPFRSPAMA